MKKLIIAGMTFLSMSTSAHAIGELTNIDLLGAQSDFLALSEDLAAALSYKAVAPAEPLGITGFDIGLELGSTSMEKSDQWAGALSNGDSISSLPMARVHAHKGLPLDIDVGLSYVTVPSTDIKIVGYELSYAFLSGGVATPAVALRLTSSKLSGVDQLDFSTTGYELSVSKGFAMLTPYVGIGRVKTSSEVAGTAAGLFTKESFTDSKTIIGVNINLGMNIGIETDKTGDATSYNIKFGIRF